VQLVHNLVDSVRGVSKVIYSNLTDAEATDTSQIIMLLVLMVLLWVHKVMDQ
jgi:hypothetical protein